MLRLIQISDSHLVPKNGSFRFNRDPFLQLKEIVGSIKSRGEHIDIVIHTGDLCGLKGIHATELEYLRAKEILDGLPCPYVIIPGNHDNKALLAKLVRSPAFRETFKLSSRVNLLRVRDFTILLIDTSEFDQRAGKLEEEDLKSIGAALKDSPTNRALIFAHHPVLPLFSPWIDETMCLLNRDRLHMILRENSGSLIGLFHGHIHREAIVSSEGVQYYSCPSTWVNYSMTTTAKDLAIELDAPYGYREIRFKDHLSTCCYGRRT